MKLGFTGKEKMMKVIDSPFLNCQPEKDGMDRWCVSSDYWSFPVADERTAQRLCEVIHGAYAAGQNDIRGQMAALIFPPMEDA